MRRYLMPCVTGHYGDLMTGHMVQILTADWTIQSKQFDINLGLILQQGARERFVTIRSP